MDEAATTIQASYKGFIFEFNTATRGQDFR